MKATGREFEPRLEHLVARVTQWSEWWSYERSSFAFLLLIVVFWFSYLSGWRGGKN
jgi:hypothetical protein